MVVIHLTNLYKNDKIYGVIRRRKILHMQYQNGHTIKILKEYIDNKWK
jgi:hypothetical protein